MSSRLHTVASFDVAYKADLARNVLEEAGIPAYVVDREIVSMEWLLGAAVNGVKVQVTSEHAERAEAILEEKFGAELQPFAEGVSDEELERQALDAGAEGDPDEVEPPTESVQTTVVEVGEPLPPEPERDQYARRFMLTSVFSLLFPPLVFYALFLGLNAAFGTGPLSVRGRRQIWFGVVFGGVWVLFVFLALQLFLR